MDVSSPPSSLTYPLAWYQQLKVKGSKTELLNPLLNLSPPYPSLLDGSVFLPGALARNPGVILYVSLAIIPHILLVTKSYTLQFHSISRT